MTHQPAPMGVAVAVVIPARNEVALIGSTVASVRRAVAEFRQANDTEVGVEILVVDNDSTDGTAEALAPCVASGAVRVVACSARGAAHARNVGARSTEAPILVFLDADTHLPLGAIGRFVELVGQGFEAGIARLGALDGGLRAQAWWAFWNAVRHLPLPRAKAMPACMFCTRAAFDEFGPFDERVAIGEEWPILAGLYRRRRQRLIYDHATTALSSSRRMELQRFGYTRTLLRYVWAILCHRGRIHYSDRVRHAVTPPAPSRGGSKRLPAALGPILAQVRLHRFRVRVDPAGVWHLAKRRRWWAGLVIPLGNLYLRQLGARAEVLGERAWHDRERAIHWAMNGLDCPTDSSRWLWLPRWPGRTLDEIAADRERPPAERRAALAAAAGALSRLHQILVDGSTPFSHGDATLRNVQFDPATGQAAWFDFDTAHLPHLLTVERHADDLRTLIYSAVASAADLAVPDLYRVVRAAYPNPAVWDHLRDRLRVGPIHHSAFHFAQARPHPRRQIELESLVRCGSGDALDLASGAGFARRTTPSGCGHKRDSLPETRPMSSEHPNKTNASLSESTGAVGSPSDIKEHMEVVASCGTPVGKVDHVEGDTIKLTRKDSADGQHHRIPLAWVAKVHDHIHLNKDHNEVQSQWQSA